MINLCLENNTDVINKFFMSLDAHVGLIFACPFEDEIASCPLIDLRLKNSISKRVLAWKMMSDTDLTDLIDKHHVCMAYRAKKTLCL